MEHLNNFLANLNPENKMLFRRSGNANKVKDTKRKYDQAYIG